MPKSSLIKNVPPRRGWCCAALLLLASPCLSAAIQVTDDLGQVVTLEQPAQRIVSLAPHITELLFAAGAGARLIGAAEFSDYPEAAKQVPRIGRHNAFDMEKILALKPDLVVAWGSGTPRHYVDRIRALGLRVFVSEPQHLDDVAATLERFGRLADVPEAAGRAREFRSGVNTLRETYANRARVRVFYEIWDAPLMTVNHQHVIDEIITLCGGVNVFSALAALTPNVDVEAVLAAEPQVIIAASGDGDGTRWLETWRHWPVLPAVQGGNLFHLNADTLHRATPRLLEGATRVCETLAAARRNVPRAANIPAN